MQTLQNEPSGKRSYQEQDMTQNHEREFVWLGNPACGGKALIRAKAKALRQTYALLGAGPSLNCEMELSGHTQIRQYPARCCHTRNKSQDQIRRYTWQGEERQNSLE